MIAALALALTSPSAALLQRYQGGGEAVSSDGRWRVWSPGSDADSDEPAVAWLIGADGTRRRVARFERLLEVTWPKGRAVVILRAITLHFSTIRVIDLAGRDAHDPSSVQSGIEAYLRGRPPRLASIGNRWMAWGEAAQSPCALVEEAGLPPGRMQGSFLSRRAAFRVDLSRRTVVPIATCPGAVLS